MPFRKKNYKKQWLFCEELFIRENRHQIETSFSLLSDVMGLNRLRARTLNGLLLKVYAFSSSSYFSYYAGYQLAIRV